MAPNWTPRVNSVRPPGERGGRPDRQGVEFPEAKDLQDASRSSSLALSADYDSRVMADWRKLRLRRPILCKTVSVWRSERTPTDNMRGVVRFSPTDA